jgi:hypothetical protein
MKAYGGVDVYIHIFLISAVVRGEWSASRPCGFTPEERAPSTYSVGGSVGPRSGLDGLEYSDSSVAQPVACHYTDYAIQALLVGWNIL